MRKTALLGLRQRQPKAAFGLMLAGLVSLGTAFAQEATTASEQPPDKATDRAPVADADPGAAALAGREPVAGYLAPPNPVNDYLDAIDRIEADYGPYATELSDLYLGLGQTLLENGEYERARDAFNRGVMVVRVNAGPNSPEQTNHLYLIANVETMLGELKAADEVVHNIYFINSYYYGEDSPEMLPVLDRIYRWYQLTRPPGSDVLGYGDYERTVGLAEELVELSEATLGPDHPNTAEAYRRLGEAQFQAVRYLIGEGMALTLDAYVAVSSGTLDSPSVVKVSVGKHYDAGRRAFKRYIESILADRSKTPPDYARAFANLGDWYLAFGKSRTARGLYEQAWQVLAASEEYAELTESYMGQPKPVHFFTPQPDFLADAPQELQELNLDISMTVTSFGDVRYVEVLNAPEGLTEALLGQIKRQVRETPFRPAMKAGEVVTTKDFIWQYAITPMGNPS